MPGTDRLTWRRDGLALAGALLLAAVLLTGSLVANSGLTMDSPEYARIAEAMARTGACPDGYENHGYPAMILIAHGFLPGRELPGRVVSLLAALALVAIVYLFARRLLGRGFATLAALLVAAHPTLTVYGTAVMSDLPFLALAYGSLLWIAMGRAAAGGALLGAAFWVRPEAALFAAGAAAAGRRILPVLVAAAVVGATYVGFLRWERHAWMPTPKFVTQMREAQPEFRLGAGGAVPEERADPGVVGSAIAANLGHWRARLPGHLRQLLLAWPLPLMALSVAGWDRRKALLLVPFLSLAVLVLVAQAPGLRLVLAPIPALAIFAAAGCARLAARFPFRGAAAVWGTVALAGLGLCWAGEAGWRALQFDDGPMPEMRAAGEWLHDHAPPGTAVMDRKDYIPFFAGFRHVQLPDNDVGTIVDYAQRTACRFLVVEEYIADSVRPQLRPLVTNPQGLALEPRLRLVYAQRDQPRGGIAIFEVAPGSAVNP